MNVTLLQIGWGTVSNALARYTLTLLTFFFMAGTGYAQTDAYTAAGLPVPTVSSDKDDYAPGEVAIITGTGWTLDQQVDVHFEETPAFHAEHQHDYHGIAVDANGTWVIRYQIEQRHFGVAFDVHVIGKQTGREAHTYFTDGGVQFKANGLPDPTSVTISSISFIHHGNGKLILDPDKSFNAPSGAVSLSSSAEDGTKVSFKYPLSISKSDGKIYTLATNDVTAISTAKSGATKPVSVTYNSTTQLWELIAVSDPITVTASYRLSTSPTSLTVSSATGTFSGTTSLSATLKSGTTNLSGKTINFTLNGTSAGSAITNALGVATLSDISIAGINANTTPYTGAIGASFTADANYSASSGSGDLTVNKATTTTVVSLAAGPFTYTGSAITPATVSVTGPGLNLTPAASYSNNVNAGTATASYSYAETANYEASSDSKTFSIGKANATIVVTGKTIIYDGATHSATGTVVGVNEEDLSNLLNLGASFTNVPGGTAEWSFAGNSNYNATSGTAAIVINKATTTLTLADLTHTYDGTTKAATATTSPAGLTGVSISNNGKTDAGAYTVTASLNNTNYEAQEVTANLVINKANQTIIWTTPEAITYGAALSTTQLNATVAGVSGGSAAGALSYSPAAGVKLAAGSHKLTVTAASTSNYNGAIEEVSLTVDKANATISVAGKTVTYNSAAHAATGTASGVDGENLNSLLDLGTSFINVPGGTAYWSFAGDNNYNSANGSVAIVINKAPVTLALGNLTHTYDGTLKSATVTATPNVSGVSVSGSGTNAGEYAASASLTNNNYEATPVSGTLSIAKATATVVVTGKTVTYNGTAHGATGTAKGVNNEFLEGLSLGDSFTNVPGGTASWSFTNANYKDQSGTAAIVINKAPVTLTLGNLDHIYDGIEKTATVTASPAVEGVYVSGSGTNAGEYVATASLTNTNYEATPVSGTLKIAKKDITGSFTAANKMFDGTTAATVTAYSVATKVGSDDVNITGGTASFETASAGLGKTVTLIGATLTGGESNNYHLASVSTATANIYAAPSVTLLASDPVQINGTSTITATLDGDVFAKVWNVVSPNGSTATYAVTGNTYTITSSIVGVYTITMSYENGIGEKYTADKVFAVFFDPTAGFVTGGGWIDSPKGASTLYPEAIGKANFGFVSKYEKGAKVPTGNTEFQFKAGDLNFKSTNYQWLTVSGARAQYKGSGTINGTGSYGFMLTAIDGQVNGGGGVDQFRIKIWNGTNENSIVYDNQIGASDDAALTTAIQGSIVIHTPPTNTKGSTTTTTKRVVGDEATVDALAAINAYPNPLRQQLFVELPEMAAQQVSLIIYSTDGRIMLRKLVQTTGTSMKVELNESFDQWPAGMYLLKVDAQGQQKVVKLVK